ncbi:MAG: hypothetical protein ABJB09_00030 [Verrucomicrobiota bacterium]
MKSYLAGIFIFTCIATTVFSADDSAGRAQRLATEVWKASGGENWARVKEVAFTFVVDKEEKTVFSAQHLWNVPADTDEVKWKDKEGKEHHVTVDLATAPTEGEEKDAYARWVNDSYWLLAPLKILDRGVQLEAGETKAIGGVDCETLRISFEKVGLTPSDQYLLYIDGQTKLLRAWDYIPATGKGMQTTWEKYESFGGLKLATEHNFEGRTIKLVDIKVATGE